MLLFAEIWSSSFHQWKYERKIAIRLRSFLCRAKVKQVYTSFYNLTFFQYGTIRRDKELKTFGLHKTDRAWLVLSRLHTARGTTQGQMREAWTRGWRARGFTRGMKMCDEKWGRVRSRKNTVLDYWKFTLYVYRNCIGQSFALAEIKTAIAMILRK